MKYDIPFEPSLPAKPLCPFAPGNPGIPLFRKHFIISVIPFVVTWNYVIFKFVIITWKASRARSSCNSRQSDFSIFSTSSVFSYLKLSNDDSDFSENVKSTICIYSSKKHAWFFWTIDHWYRPGRPVDPLCPGGPGGPVTLSPGIPIHIEST